MQNTGTGQQVARSASPSVSDIFVPLIAVAVIVGLLWAGVSWVWGVVSGDAADQQAQLEQTWTEAAPSARGSWCTWAVTGNLTGAGSALVLLGANTYGYDLDEQSARELIMDRCGLR